MKKMKRMAAAIALLLIATVFLGACGSKEKICRQQVSGRLGRNNSFLSWRGSGCTNDHWRGFYSYT